MTRSPDVSGTGRFTPRIVYLGLAGLTIVLGLLVHRGVIPFGASATDVLGDALWAAMMVWWISAVVPGAPLLARGGVALGICVAVELSQVMHTPALDAARQTTLGRLVLGSGFDPRDLLAYALGVVAACAGVRYASRTAGLRHDE